MLSSGPRERRLQSSPQLPQVSLASRSRILLRHLPYSRLCLLVRLTSAQIPLQTFPSATGLSLITVLGVTAPAFCRWGASFCLRAGNHQGDNFVLGRSLPKTAHEISPLALFNLLHFLFLQSPPPLLLNFLFSQSPVLQFHRKHLNITHLGESEFSISVKPSVVISRHPGGMRYQPPASPFHLSCPEICPLQSWWLCTYSLA